MIKFNRIVHPSFKLDPTQDLSRDITPEHREELIAWAINGDNMEKQAVIAEGVTPEVKPVEKQARHCDCAGKCKKPTLQEKVAELEDDAVARLVKKAAGE